MDKPCPNSLTNWTIPASAFYPKRENLLKMSNVQQTLVSYQVQDRLLCKMLKIGLR